MFQNWKPLFTSLTNWFMFLKRNKLNFPPSWGVQSLQNGKRKEANCYRKRKLNGILVLRLHKKFEKKTKQSNTVQKNYEKFKKRFSRNTWKWKTKFKQKQEYILSLTGGHTWNKWRKIWYLFCRTVGSAKKL
jgi:hypothetical protein